MKKIITSFFIFISIFLCACNDSSGTAISDLNEANEYELNNLNLSVSTGDDGVNSSFDGYKESAALSEMICVSITGAVLNPGVYYLKEGSRVFELINAAGGLLEEASTQNLNLVSMLSDGIQINIADSSTNVDSAPNSDNAGNFVSNSPGLININTASLDELTALPSIGTTRARAIIEYREKNSGFSSIDDIKNVSGIKEGTFDKIKDLICTY